MGSRAAPFPAASFAGHLIGWPTQCGGLICLGLSTATENGVSIGLPVLAFAWLGFAGVLLFVVPGLLLAVRPRLLGGPVGWLLRLFDRPPLGGHRWKSLHDLGIELAYWGLAFCGPSALMTSLALTLRDTTRAVLIGVAVGILLLPLYLVGYWRLLGRHGRTS